jgi:PAS domain S-box-containing protein
LITNFQYSMILVFISLVTMLAALIMAYLSPVRIPRETIAPLAREYIVEKMSDVVIVLDEDDNIIYYNPSASQLFGKPLTETSGKNIEKVWLDWPKTSQQNVRGALTHQEIALGEGLEERVYDLIYSTIKADMNRIKWKILVLRDITAHKRAQAYWETQLTTYNKYLERLVEERTRKLRGAERLATIGELAAMVGHDLRNPLTAISGAAYYMRNVLEPNEDDKLIELLEFIESNVRESNRILNDLRDYSKEESLEILPSNLKNLIDETISSTTIPEDIRVLNLIQDDVTFFVDPSRIKRVFLNLIDNAVDAMPQGGTLTIENMKTQDLLEVTFTDTGSGIPEEIIEDIWKPLFTTKARGMGFGLAICKKIVEAHDGSISVNSSVGEGTSFKMTFLTYQNDISAAQGHENNEIRPEIFW